MTSSDIRRQDTTLARRHGGRDPVQRVHVWSMGRSIPALLAALAVLAAGPAAARADVSFTAKGRWMCNNRGTVVPIAGARVELGLQVPSGYFNLNIARAHTGPDGSFHFDDVQVPSIFDVSVELVLNDDTGVNLGDWYWRFSDWSTRTQTIHSRNGVIDFGTQQIDRDTGKGTPRCAVWQGAHDAYQDFRAVTGQAPPESSYSLSYGFPCCGVPFTTTHATFWPSGYATGDDYSVSRHEFAHSVRHAYDGGFPHFLFDAARFEYLQNHNLLSVTNPGFAFNEGWAEYWADTTQPCADPTNLSCEGNVATALKALEGCASRATMARVLQENPGTIHSFSEFEGRFFTIVPRGHCVLGPVVSPGGLTNIERTLSAGEQTTALQGQIAAEQRLIVALIRRRAPTRRGARGVGPCTSTTSRTSVVARLTAPSALNTQIAQAKLVLARLNAGLAAARKARFQPDLAALTELDTSQRGFDRANQAVVLAGLEAGERAVGARAPGRAKATAEFRRMQRAVALLTSARKRHAITPTQVTSLFSPSSPPVDVARRTNPPTSR